MGRGDPGYDADVGRAWQAAISSAQTAVHVRIKAGEGFIYVAEIIGTDTVKVGFSLDPERRMRDFRGAARLLGSFPATLTTERRLHRHLREYALPKDTLGRECYPRSALRQAA